MIISSMSVILTNPVVTRQGRYTNFDGLSGISGAEANCGHGFEEGAGRGVRVQQGLGRVLHAGDRASEKHDGGLAHQEPVIDLTESKVEMRNMARPGDSVRDSDMVQSSLVAWKMLMLVLGRQQSSSKLVMLWVL